MPQPTTSAVHVDRPLTNIAVMYSQTGNFIARQVFPNVPVAKQSDQYWKYTKADWLRIEAQRRAPGTESAGSGWSLSTASYRADVYAIHKDIDDETRANQDNPINMDRDATRWITRQLLMKMEALWTSKYWKTGVWDTTKTGTTNFTKWSASGGDPVGDIALYKDTVMGLTGYTPNVGVAGVRTARQLRNNADVIDRIKYTQRGVVTNDLLAAMLDLDSFLIPTAINDPAVEGATSAPAFIATDDSFLLVYRTPTPSLMEPSAGYTFSWTGLIGGSEGYRIKRFRMDHLNSERVEGEMAFDQKVVAADLGVMFLDAVD